MKYLSQQTEMAVRYLEAVRDLKDKLSKADIKSITATKIKFL